MTAEPSHRIAEIRAHMETPSSMMHRGYVRDAVEFLLGEIDRLHGQAEHIRALHQSEACCMGEAMCCPQCVGHWPCDTAKVLAAVPGKPQPTEEP